MKRLIAAILVGSGLWAGYWWVGINGLRSGITQALRQSGDYLQVADWRAQGFPSRFDVEITGAELSGNGWRWSVPEAEIMAMAWAPTKLIVWAGVPQSLSLYGQEFAISAKDMRANVDFGASASLPLERINAVLDAPQIGGARADQARLALQRDEGRNEGREEASARYRIGGAITALNGADLHWDADVTLPAPLDRASLTRPIPRPQTIDLKDFTLKASGAEMRASGALTVTPQGYLDGPLAVEITDPAALVAALRRSELLAPDQIAIVERVLRAIRGKDGRSTVPLRFVGGQTLVGGLIPVGPAPRWP